MRILWESYGCDEKGDTTQLTLQLATATLLSSMHSIIMKITSSALLILLSLSAPIVDARQATSSLTSIPRGGATKQPVAFHKNARVWGDVNTKEVRGGDGGGTSTMTSHLFNMVKAIVGVGVLSLPAGEYYILICVRNVRSCK